MTPRRTAGSVVAALAAATTWLIAPASPAGAATCSTARGVSVVVDHHELGGGVQTVCDSGGSGKYADRQFSESGFALTYVQRQPGFVCRVNGTPANDPCVNTPPSDAYWGLWWSDGTSGKWTYASTGVQSLKVPAGGYVALSWNGTASSNPPGVTPNAHASAPSSSATPTASPTPQPTHSASPGPPPTSPPPTSPPPTSPPSSLATTPPAPTSSAASASSTPNPNRSATPLERPGRHHQKHRDRATASASPDAGSTSTATVDPQPTGAVADPPVTSGSGLPDWLAPAVVGLLLAVAGAVAVVRRRVGRS